MSSATAVRLAADPAWGRRRLVWVAIAVLLLGLAGTVAAEPQPVPEAELHAFSVGFGGGGSSDDEEDEDEDEPRPFDIDASDTDLNMYAMDCFQTSDSFVEFRAEAYASTVANRSAHYLAVDVKLEANGVVRKQKFRERDGPTSAVSASVTYRAPCNDYSEFWSVSARGWHKGIGDPGGSAEYKSTSD